MPYLRMKSLGKLSLFSCLTLFSPAGFAANKADQIAERVKPAGTVCLAGDTCASEVAVVASSDGPRSAEDIYNTNCTACHSTGAAGAPIKGNAAHWKPRLAKGKETLYENAIKGIGAMPAKGLCMNCSDEEIKATVDYLTQ